MPYSPSFHYFSCGIIFFQVFYMIFLAYHGKNRLFHLYAVYLVFLLVYFSYIHYYLQWPQLFAVHYWAQAFYERLVQWLPGTLALIYTIFFRKVLELDKTHPFIGKVSRYSQRGIEGLMALDLVLFLLRINEHSRTIYYMCTIVFFLVSTYCIVALFGKTRGYARFFVWGSLVICLTASLVSMLIILYGSMELNNSGRFFIIVEAGTLLETFLFTCGISYRHFMSEREKTKLAESLHSIRNKISADLHDHIGSALSSIAIFSKVAGDKTSDPVYTAEALKKIEDKSVHILSEMNDVVWLINPVNDSMEKLVTRMNDHALSLLSPMGIRFQYHTDSVVDQLAISMEERKALYMVYREALNNCAKYSGCSVVDASLVHSAGMLRMEITDNGRGFDQHTVKNGNGLFNMRSRAEALNGQFSLQTVPGNGTRIQLSLPVQ
jgi:signal transduction histidine kinase